MNTKLKGLIVPAVVLALFFVYFHNFPRVVEDYFNILVLASVLSPLVVVMFSRAKMVTRVVQAVFLQTVFLAYGAWFWKHMDALREGYFSFENPLMLNVLLVLFAISLVLASLVRLGIDRMARRRAARRT